MGVSFETCLRRREDVPLRSLGDVPLRRRWVFHLRRTCDVTGTYRETSLRRRYDVLLPGGKVIFMYHTKSVSNQVSAKFGSRNQKLFMFKFQYQNEKKRKSSIKFAGLQNGAIRGLQMGAGFRD